VFGTEMCLAARSVYYLKEYVSFVRRTDVSITRTTARSTNASAVTAYHFVESLELDRNLELSRKLALKRLVPIVVSIYARNQAPLQALGIALKHLYAYDNGLSKRLYFHLMLIAKSLFSMQTLRGSKLKTEPVDGA
jgi:hypothetical protein